MLWFLAGKGKAKGKGKGKGKDTDMLYTITIPNWLPTPINQILSAHPMARGRLKNADAEMIKGYALLAGTPKATGKRRMTLCLEGWSRGGRRFDPDACLKTVLDALVVCGLLIDDTARWVELGPPEVRHAPKTSTRIVLEEMDGMEESR